MKYLKLLKYVLAFTLLAFILPDLAAAYVGPGAGLSAIGVFLSVVAAVVVAIFGFVWYPVKRLVRKIKKPKKDI